MPYYKVKDKGYRQYVKDSSSGAILLNDMKIKDEAEAKTRAANEINSMKSDISTLKDDIADIKYLLLQLTGRLK